MVEGTIRKFCDIVVVDNGMWPCAAASMVMRLEKAAAARKTERETATGQDQKPFIGIIGHPPVPLIVGVVWILCRGYNVVIHRRIVFCLDGLEYRSPCATHGPHLSDQTQKLLSPPFDSNFRPSIVAHLMSPPPLVSSIRPTTLGTQHSQLATTYNEPHKDQQTAGVQRGFLIIRISQEILF